MGKKLFTLSDLGEKGVLFLFNAMFIGVMLSEVLPDSWTFRMGKNMVKVKPSTFYWTMLCPISGFSGKAMKKKKKTRQIQIFHFGRFLFIYLFIFFFDFSKIL